MGFFLEKLLKPGKEENCYLWLHCLHYGYITVLKLVKDRKPTRNGVSYSAVVIILHIEVILR